MITLIKLIMIFFIFTVSSDVKDSICNFYNLYIFILLFILFPTFILHDLLQNSLRFFKVDIFILCKIKILQKHTTNVSMRKDKEYKVDTIVSDSQDICNIKNAFKD